MDEKLEKFYGLCLAKGLQEVFYQNDLLSLGVAQDMTEVKELCEKLGRMQRLKMLESEKGLCWRVRSRDVALQLCASTDDERMIFNHIDDSKGAGMWTKTLKNKTNLHQAIITKSVKNLVGRNLIESVVNQETPTRKIYRVKGAAAIRSESGFYDNGEVDVDMVKAIQGVLYAYIQDQSWRELTGDEWLAIKAKDKRYHASNRTKRKRTVANKRSNIAESSDYEQEADPLPLLPRGPNRFPLVPREPGHIYPTLSKIREHLNTSQISQKLLSRDDVAQLIDMMKYEGQLEEMGKPQTVEGGTEEFGYRACRKYMMIHAFGVESVLF